MSTTADRAQTLLDLHEASEILVLANVWDVVSATAVAGTAGVKALATASHAIAATFGYEDGENIPLELHLDMVRRIVEAVELPVSMDFEAGYGDAGETARRALAIGVAGGNLEDEMRSLAEAVAAVEAVVRAGEAEGVLFVLNARTDAFLKAGDRPRGEVLAEAIERGRAFLEAGAPVVFVPGAVDRAEIEQLVAGLGERKLTVIPRPGPRCPLASCKASASRASRRDRSPNACRAHGAAGRRGRDRRRRGAAGRHPRAELSRRSRGGPNRSSAG